MLFQLEVVVNRLSIITATALILGAGVASAQDKPLLGLVMKANDVPFWQQMQKQAADTAKSLDVDLQVFAGSSVADNEAQVSAVESLISAGAKGILITPADPGPQSFQFLLKREPLGSL
uniref:substrate-binding domain-containing protein n=1 Tax=Rhizobium sp. RCAM05350 TaxID=2895568 RepID=UPI0020769279|nr:substrate-binding domain-containing protein [Rhizobium sp. RCAM05350]